MSLPARCTIVELARQLAAPEPPPDVSIRVIAIDGLGGAGKSTLAARLSPALGHAPIVHTDDFASWDEPLEWWPRFLDEALRPLAAGTSARYRRYDWDRHELGDWVETPTAACI